MYLYISFFGSLIYYHEGFVESGIMGNFIGIFIKWVHKAIDSSLFYTGAGETTILVANFVFKRSMTRPKSAIK